MDLLTGLLGILVLNKHGLPSKRVREAEACARAILLEL
jgi:hypothetical protein